MEQLKIGDIVKCEARLGRAGQTLKIFQAVIIAISDGSERKVPGELMYQVHRQNHGPTWVKQSEIVQKLAPSEAARVQGALYWTSIIKNLPSRARLALGKALTRKGG